MFFFFLGFFGSSLFTQQVPLLSALILLLHLFGYTTNECKTEIHDLPGDADYAAASKQGSSSLTRIDSNKRSSSSDPEDAQIVYLKDNVTIHPTQYATERISGRLKFDQTSWSKTSLNYWDTVFINLPKLEKR